MDNEVRWHPQFGYKLFHYTKTDNFINILDSKQLWLSGKNTGTWDDANELYYSFENLKSDLEILGPPYDKYLHGIDEKTIIKNIEGMKQSTYIISFSRTPCNKNQWDEYAGNNGVSISFESEQFVRRTSLDEGKFAYFGDVDYVQDLKTTSDLLLKAISDPHFLNYSDSHKALIGWLRLYAFIKNGSSTDGKKDYSVEDETRFVFVGSQMGILCKNLYQSGIYSSNVRNYLNDTGLGREFDKNGLRMAINLSSLTSINNTFPFFKIYYNNKDDKKKIREKLDECGYSGVPMKYVDVSKIAE